jgi:hypothetical protein
VRARLLSLPHRMRCRRRGTCSSVLVGRIRVFVLLISVAAAIGLVTVGSSAAANGNRRHLGSLSVHGSASELVALTPGSTTPGTAAQTESTAATVAGGSANLGLLRVACAS